MQTDFDCSGAAREALSVDPGGEVTYITQKTPCLESTSAVKGKCTTEFHSDGVTRVLQTDFGYFGPPEEHFQWTQEDREATYITPEDPSSEICGEVAAAFAASSLALRDTGTPRLAACQLSSNYKK